ncbi:hypothetical protein ACFVUY_30100 [Kitasatospora sp. NPDC058063]|uniref:hypothetical protein n=1 Tax=unclassified Kitasatospora TaxID=2633591 RepID=UPI0036DD1041
MKELIRRRWPLPLAGAALALLVFGLSLSGMLAQHRAADRIDASPLRVDATISAERNREKSGVERTLTYRVGEREYSTTSLKVGRAVAHPAVGVTVPLEVAADHPATARVLGTHYPDDDMPDTQLLIATFSAMALLTCLWFVVTGVRSRSRTPSPAPGDRPAEPASP